MTLLYCAKPMIKYPEAYAYKKCSWNTKEKISSSWIIVGRTVCSDFFKTKSQIKIMAWKDAYPAEQELDLGKPASTSSYEKVSWSRCAGCHYFTVEHRGIAEGQKVFFLA